VAVMFSPAAAEAHNKGKLDEAAAGYARTVRLNPRFAEAYNNLGVLLRKQGKREASAACYRKALAIKPNTSSFLSNLGNVLRELGQHQAAAASHQKAVKLAPNVPEPIYNLGLVLRDLGHLSEAHSCFARAITLKPDYVDARWDRSLTLLQMGQYEEGFKEYEWRWHLPENANRLADRPRWDGSDLTGKTILIEQEQGMGDMIQFIRYAPFLKQCGAKTVIVECLPPLGRLFSMAAGVDKVVFKGEPLPDFDFYAPIMSLAAYFGTTLETIPSSFPYLGAPTLHKVRVPAPRDTLLKVGLTWAGRPTHQNDRNRTTTLDHFLKLTGLPATAFFSLQKGDREKDLQTHGAGALITDLAPQLGDFADTAAAMGQLDLLISVDTSVVHLAGAVGLECWVLLPFACDWRWLSGRADSPWYPSLRLFRQEKPGDWTELFERVNAALGEKLKDIARKRGVLAPSQP
jgi:hypothetical protein